MRTLFGVMKEDYNWEYKLEKDFNFDGGFAAKMKVLREERMEDWPDLGTGKTCRMLESNQCRMSISQYSMRTIQKNYC